MYFVREDRERGVWLEGEAGKGERERERERESEKKKSMCKSVLGWACVCVRACARVYVCVFAYVRALPL